MPPAPIVIGLILGSLFDMSLGQSLLIGQGSYLVFLQSPLATTFLVLAALALLQATPFFGWLRRRLLGPGPSSGSPRGTE